jgi:hypothetical protein
MKNTLHKKLNAYALTAGTLTLVSTAEAQITYVDINPDIILSDLGFFDYDLDVDGDGVKDFNFYLLNAGLNYFTLYPFNSNSAVLAEYTNPPYDYTSVLDSTDSISPNDTSWRSGTTFISYLTTGDWIGATDKYLAFKADLSGQLHCGWVRMTMSADADSLIIKDYAYNATPDSGLLAGQTSTVTGIAQSSEITSPQLHTYANTLFVQLREQPVSAYMIHIYNATGQLMTSRELTGTASRIALNDLSTGIYIVQLQYNGQLVSKKIYVN